LLELGGDQIAAVTAMLTASGFGDIDELHDDDAIPEGYMDD